MSVTDLPALLKRARELSKQTNPGPWRYELGDWEELDEDLIRVFRLLIGPLLDVAEAVSKAGCSCVGLTYQGNHTSKCESVRAALAKLGEVKL